MLPTRLTLPLGLGLTGLLALGIATARPGAGGAAPQTTVTASRVSGKVHVIEGAGAGNVGVFAGESGVLVIDDQTREHEAALLSAIDGISKSPWRFVLNTHHHGDHTGNNASFGRRAPIVAHRNVRARLLGDRRGPAPAEALPILTYDDGITVHLDDEEIRVEHHAGAHTDGDSVVYFAKANVVHLGDLFFAGRFPFVDIDGGGSVRGLIRALDAILPKLQVDAKLIPGHGPISTVEDLKAYRAMLIDTLAIVEKQLAAGKTAEQIKSERALAKYEALSWKFIDTNRYVDTLVRELGGK